MKRLLIPLAALTFVFCLAHDDAAIAQSPPEDPPGCDVQTFGNHANACPATRVAIYAKSCPRTGDVVSCVLLHVVPKAEIQCDGLAGTIWCEAWPQTANNDYYHYTWSISGGNPAPQPGSLPLGTTTCVGNHFVTVTVSGPTELFDSATFRVNCNGQ